MHRRKFLAGTVAVSTSLVAGCGGSGNGNGDSDGGDGDESGGGTTTPATNGDASGNADVTVEMVSTSFEPVEVSVDVGDTVRWVNNDSFGHDVTSEQFTSDAATWELSEAVSGGGSVTHTFDSSGVYEYYCTIHGKTSMCGVVLVGDVSYEGTLPCQNGGDGY